VQGECERKGASGVVAGRERDNNKVHSRKYMLLLLLMVRSAELQKGRPADKRVASLTVPTANCRRLIAPDTLEPRHKYCRPWLAYIFEFV
jgi:hypothetical protein